MGGGGGGGDREEWRKDYYSNLPNNLITLQVYTYIHALSGPTQDTAGSSMNISTKTTTEI